MEVRVGKKGQNGGVQNALICRVKKGRKEKSEDSLVRKVWSI